MSVLAGLAEMLGQTDFVAFTGKVTAVGQNEICADGPHCGVGDFVRLGGEGVSCLAQVVAVDRDRVRLLPVEPSDRVLPGTRVELALGEGKIRSGDGFAGRAIDGFGRPIDGGRPVAAPFHQAQDPAPSLRKTVVAERVATGIRALDTLIPIARGQRIGIFAASGVGKTTLLEQLTGQIRCDRKVVCLIGERGREVERMWALQRNHGSENCTLIAATSDEKPGARVRAMEQALALCEFWRARGEHVVLFVDSITRLAMALREIGLAAGEPPSIRSYTPNVFAALPAYVERCGALRESGSITAIFTVLSETDDVDDPIVETMKSILDGHVVLSRKLAEKSHYPAIDIAASISRVADQLLDAPTADAANRLRATFAEYETSRAMIESGIYQAGSSAAIDHAIALRDRIRKFLVQKTPDAPKPELIDRELQNLMAAGGQT